ITGRVAETTTDANGVFTIYNVPHNPYTLTIESKDFQTFTRDLDIHNDTVMDLGDLALTIAGATEVVTVAADTSGNVIETDNTSSHIDIDKSLIQRFPAATASRGTEQILLSTPGFVEDENGRFHFRGSHGQVGYVIDGVPVNDQVHVTF